MKTTIITTILLACFYFYGNSQGDIRLSIHLVDSTLAIRIDSLNCIAKYNKLPKKVRKKTNYLQFIENCKRKDRVIGCDCCFDINKEQINKEPVITNKDIDSINWEKQIFYINQSRIILIQNQIFGTGNNKPLAAYGVPAVLKINDEPIYVLWFFPKGSSLACDRVHAHFYKNGMYTRFGIDVANYVFGKDPRYVDCIKDALTKQLR